MISKIRLRVQVESEITSTDAADTHRPIPSSHGGLRDLTILGSRLGSEPVCSFLHRSDPVQVISFLPFP